jgi:hypothetical protein
MASLKDFSSRSLVLVITRSSTVRSSVSSSSDGGGHQEKLGTSMDPSNKNGDLKRFDQAKPGELFCSPRKKSIAPTETKKNWRLITKMGT